MTTRLLSCCWEEFETLMSKLFLHGAGPLIVIKQLSGSISSLVWGRCGWLKWAKKAALSLHVFILLASTSLDFLSFSALTSSTSPAPLSRFVSVSLYVRSLSATQGNGQTSPEQPAPEPAGTQGSNRATRAWQASPSTKWLIRLPGDQSRR